MSQRRDAWERRQRDGNVDKTKKDEGGGEESRGKKEGKNTFC